MLRHVRENTRAEQEANISSAALSPRSVRNPCTRLLVCKRRLELASLPHRFDGSAGLASRRAVVLSLRIAGHLRTIAGALVFFPVANKEAALVGTLVGTLPFCGSKAASTRPAAASGGFFANPSLALAGVSGMNAHLSGIPLESFAMGWPCDSSNKVSCPPSQDVSHEV